jgi:hypothetical protein
MKSPNARAYNHTKATIRSLQMSVPSFSPGPANEAVGAKPSIYQWPATRVPGPITQVCDRYVQYLLAGANRTVLNRHRRGLQPWRCRLSTYHSPTFPTSCLPFPLVVPPSLHLIKFHQLNQSVEFKDPMAAMWSFNHSAIYHSLHLRQAIANDLSLVEGSQG